jgi:hypothetical protein
MATQFEDLTDSPEDEATESEQPENEQFDGGEGEHVEISFGDTPVAGDDESEGVRNLRRRLREREDELRALRGQAQPDTVGDKPTMDDYWDRPDEYERDLLAWSERKRKSDDAQREQQQQAEVEQRKFADASSSYDRQRASLPVANFDAAHDRLVEKLGEPGLRVLNVVAGDKSAALVYALGNTPDRLEALGKHNLRSLPDLLQFAAEVGSMAKAVNVNDRRKPATQPESVHRGSGGGSGRGDAKLERLEREARTSGNRTDLINYKREKGID